MKEVTIAKETSKDKIKKPRKKEHSFLKAFGILSSKEMSNYNYKRALNRDTLWERS